MTPTFSQIEDIINWASEAGRREVLMALHEGRHVDFEGGMGLWQSFQARFPKSQFPGTYDAAIHLYAEVYRASIENCDKAIKGEW